jgi:transcriptional regulator with XRE-family HTH domain
MPQTGSPTARRRELGSMLRSLRTTKRLTTQQVAGLIGFSRSKISRLENGRRGASQVDILRLCEFYEVDSDERLRLTELAAEGKQRAWWQPFSLPYSDYVGLESEAASISDFALAIVPGLLQTPDYARALLRAGVQGWEPRVVEERVDARIARQRRLSSGTTPAGKARPTFEAVLDESVLHRVVGSPAVMLAQLRQVHEMSQLPNVTIRIVPYDAGSVPSGVNKFVILRFAQDNISDIVLIEDLTTHRYLDDPGEVETYTATFATLVALAASPAASEDMILAEVAAYELKIG